MREIEVRTEDFAFFFWLFRGFSVNFEASILAAGVLRERLETFLFVRGRC